MRPRPTYLKSSGFTLFETLVALTILGMAISVVIQLYSANIRALSTSEERLRASMRAEAKMREVLLRDVLDEGRWDEMTEEGFRYTVTVREALTGRTENLPVRLMQIHLSVSWERGNKEHSLGLTTMRVEAREL